MTPENLQALRERSAAVARLRDELLATPAEERKTKGSISRWNGALQAAEKLASQLDSLVTRMELKAAAKVPRAMPKRQAFEPVDAVVVGAVRKGPNAEVRIRVLTWEGSRNVDVRLWSRSKVEGGDYVPSRKGVMFEAAKLVEIIRGLEDARKHL